MVDGVLLLVDASEGPLPQTRFVLRKALELGLPPIVVINKIDRPDARPPEVLDEVYDLFIDLDAAEDQLDFPVLYTTPARALRYSGPGRRRTDAGAALRGDPAQPCRRRASTRDAAAAADHHLDYDDYVGRLAIGRIFNGSPKKGRSHRSLPTATARPTQRKVTMLYGYEGLKRVEIAEAGPGDIVAVAGLEEVEHRRDHLRSSRSPSRCRRSTSTSRRSRWCSSINTSPFAGRDGKHVTSRKLKERLEKEIADQRLDPRRAHRLAGRVQGLGPRRAAARDPHRDDAPRGLRAVGRQARGHHPHRRRQAPRADGAAGHRLPRGVTSASSPRSSAAAAAG